MRRSISSAVACTGLLLVTGCGSATTPSGEGPDHHGGARLQISRVSMASAGPRTSYRDLSTGQLELGHDLATRLPDDGGNLVYSPASLAIAFAMLREGAVGATATEIDSVLHLPADRRQSFNGLLHAMAESQHGDTLEVNDGLFLDPSLPVERRYLVAIKRWYGSGVERTRFPDPALQVINSWVDHGTHGRIPHLLDQLDPTSVFALVNTVYLHAGWETPFLPSDTTSAPFTTADGTRASVKTMHQTTSLDFVDGEGYRAVRLPYQGHTMSMWVLLPDAGEDPTDLLTASTVSGLAVAATRRHVDLSLPRWDVETGADLTDVLRRLGLASTFDGAGSFSALTSDPDFAVSEVIQQANITVGEKGTTAAAATAIVGESSGAVAPRHLVTFTADHPFAFVVVHDATGAPLFEGTVGDPS
jgi:serine protease inhibitor